MEENDFFDNGRLLDVSEQVRIRINEHKLREIRRKRREENKRRRNQKVMDSGMPLFEGIEIVRDEKILDLNSYVCVKGELVKEGKRNYDIFSSYQENLLGVLALYHGSRVLSKTNRLGLVGEFGKDVFSEVLRRMKKERMLSFVMGSGIYCMPILDDFHGLFGIRKNFGLPVRSGKGTSLEEFFCYLTSLGQRFERGIKVNTSLRESNERDMISHLVDIHYDKKILAYFGGNFPFEFMGRDIYPDKRTLWNSRAGSFEQVKEHPGKKYARSALKFFESRGLI